MSEKPEVKEESTEEVKESTPVITNDKQLDEVVEVMPEVVPEAVAAAEEKDAQLHKSGESVVDNKGRNFDPSIHALDPATGKPLLTPTGRFTKIKLPKDRPGIVTPPKDIPVDQSYKVVAKTVVGIFIQCGYALVGDEWLPEKSKEMDEEGNLITVTEVYCQSIGLKDLPPGIVCAVAFTAYGLRRFTRPKTKSLVQKITGGVKNFFVNMWLKFRGGKNARPNNRSNSDGKDNASVQTSAEV